VIAQAQRAADYILNRQQTNLGIAAPALSDYIIAFGYEFHP
jgi:hypothetical protein